MSGAPLVKVSEERFVVPDQALEDLAGRLAGTRLPTGLGLGWEQGVPSGWLRDLLVDWQASAPDILQRQLDGLRQFRAEVQGQSLHVVVAEGRGPDPLPLLVTHGWPGSFLEYLEVLPLLTDPGAHGADPADAFTVIVPSLPGYGFSGPPPPTGFTGHQVAALWHALMASGLGYERYVAHGSDLGAGVTAWLARNQPTEVRAIHLATPGLAPAPDPRTPPEAAYAAAVETWTAEEGGYAHEHATKPATIGAALADSPAGLAAWIAEKVVAWSSTRPDGSPAFDRQLLLSTLTLYWTTGTMTTSLLPYWAYRHNPDAALPPDDPCPVPTAVSIFGGERVPFPKPPRELARRYYTLTHWAEHSVGGHFPAVAEPQLLARTLRDVFRGCRGSADADRVSAVTSPVGDREPVAVTRATTADAGPVAELIAALESSLYGRSAFSQADLVDEWSDVDLEQNARVVRVGDRIVGYGAVRERGGRWDAEGYVHPDALGRGIGRLIATGLEQHVAGRGARRIHSTVLEPDSAGRRLIESLGYDPVRVFREVRIQLEAPPAAPRWPAGLRIAAFDANLDAREFHAAQEEAFADHWEFTASDFEAWSKEHLAAERFDATLWSVVRAGDEVAAGTICTADTYGGGWVHVLFTRRPWRRNGLATALLHETFRRFWERGEHSIGLGVDTANPTGAFRLYESAGMSPTLGLVVYEKQLGKP